MQLAAASTDGAAGRNCTTVVQLYVAFPAVAGEPPRVLRGFERVSAPSGGAAVRVAFTLSARDFSVWREGEAEAGSEGSWQRPRGAFGVHVGTSSRDLPLVATVMST